MEGMIGEIRLFAGSTAPKGWELCRGQALYISTNDTLFSIIGTAFGGDGVETFHLPNLCGSVAIGSGKGTGLTNRTLGQQLGSERVTLGVDHLPNHSHVRQATFTPLPSSITGKLMGVNGDGGQSSPAGNFIGKDTQAGSKLYASAATSLVALNEGSIVLSGLMAEQPNIRTSRGDGKDDPHPNVQPVLAVNFIICIDGIYPGNSQL